MSRITHEKLMECFEYCSISDVLRWRHRPESHFKSKRSWQSWRTRASGKVAGNYRKDGYIRVTIDGVRTYAHRIIYAMHNGLDLDGVPPEMDHVDKDNSNNRPSNLRPATRSQNVMNTVMRRDNTSGHKGVGWDKRRGAWTSRIRLNGKTYSLGSFRTAEEAGRVREAAANDLHGKFARHDSVAMAR